MTDYAPLIEEITKSIDDFQKTIPGIQQNILNEIIKDLSKLDLKGGDIAISAKNVRLISEIKSKLMKIILTDDYKDSVKEYIKGFDQVTNLQNQYFKGLEKDFKPSKLGAEIKNQSVSAVVDNLTERGIDANVASYIEDILKKSITTGGSIAELHEQLRNAITTNNTGDGLLERYTKQITTDALNQQAAQYTQLISDDLGYEWYVYQGSLIETSRPFCEACVEKKYIHVSEFPALLAGDFPEFEKHDGNMYKGLPAGMIPDTNPSNLPINRGGYNCGHQMRPVRTESVPKELREQFV